MGTRSYLVSVMAVLAVGPLPAGEPPAGVIGVMRDLRLSLQARRELRDDKLLRGHDIGVEVKAGVARVWGTVSDADLARRALSRVEHIDGVRDVVNELKTAGPIVITDAAVKALKGPSPPALPEARPQPPAQPVKREGLAERVRRTRDEARVSHVRYEVSGGVVTVFRGADDDAAALLAHRLRGLEGVEEVRLER